MIVEQMNSTCVYKIKISYLMILNDDNDDNDDNNDDNHIYISILWKLKMPRFKEQLPERE